MRTALGHDLSKAEKFNADQAAKAREDTDKRTRLAEAASPTDLFGRRVRLLLRQNFDKGWVCMGEVLADGEVEVVNSRPSSSLSGPKVINEVTRRTETRVVAELGKIMVFGLPSYTVMPVDLQGGRIWSGSIYKIGNYNLISAATEESTQTGAYHVDRDTAVRLIAENGLSAIYTNTGVQAKAESSKPVRGGTGVGTAFAITADGYFATAAHVVEHAKSIEALVNQEQRPASVIMINNELDLAIIRVDGVKVPALRLKETGKSKAGASLFAVGFPLIDALGKNAKLTTGSLTAHTGMSDDPNTFQMSIPIQPGNSGGPVCDEFGNVIGVVSKTVSTLKGAVFANGAVPQNVNFAAKADLLIDQAKFANVKLPESFEGKGTAEERVMASTVLLTVRE